MGCQLLAGMCLEASLEHLKIWHGAAEPDSLCEALALQTLELGMIPELTVVPCQL